MKFKCNLHVVLLVMLTCVFFSAVSHDIKDATELSSEIFMVCALARLEFLCKQGMMVEIL